MKDDWHPSPFFKVLLKLDIMDDDHIFFERYDSIGWDAMWEFEQVMLGKQIERKWLDDNRNTR